MAITEYKDSQEWQHTAEGTFFYRVFSMTVSDLALFTIRVGDPLGYGTLAYNLTSQWGSHYLASSLRVSDITVTRLPSPTDIRVRVTYSTRMDSATPHKEPDQLGSIEISFDMNTRVEMLDNSLYWELKDYDATAGKGYDYDSDTSFRQTQTIRKTHWRSLYYRDTYNAIDSVTSAAPMIPMYEPEIAMHLKVYTSKFWYHRIRDAVRSVNSEDYFLNHLLGLLFGPKKITVENLTTFYDLEKWLLASCPIQQIRVDCWQYDFTFLYRRWSWNEWFNKETWMYRRYAMLDLINEMTEGSEFDLPIVQSS